MLRDARSFEPSTLAALLDAVGLYPPGSSVRLSSGERAFVRRAGRHPALPVVELTHGPSGEPLEDTERATVDLGDPEGPRREVAELLTEAEVAEASCAEREDLPAPTAHSFDCGHEVAHPHPHP
jgi:hypothetical protein